MASVEMDSLRGIAEQQAGVVSRAQAKEAGLSNFAIRTRVASGAWHRAGRALVLRDLSRAGDEHLAWILTFNISNSAVITGPLAARLGGWAVPGPEMMVIEEQHRPPGLAGVRVLRRTPPEIAPGHDGLPLAPRRDALVDTLMCVSLDRAEGVLDLALQNRWLSADDLDRIVSHRAGHGRKGVMRLRHLQRRATSGSRSEAEHRMARLLAHAGGRWIANYRVHDGAGRIVAEIDFADPQHRIAIEVDGRAFHTDHRSFERDRQRQNMLALQGWIVLRFTWDRIVHDPAGVIAEVAHALEIARPPARSRRNFGR